MKIFIDTNVFLRFLLKDDPDSYEEVVKLFELVEEGKVKPYTSNIVILEIIYVLVKTLKISRTEVLRDIQDLFSMRGLIILEKTNTKEALKIFKQTGVKFADCLIATQIKSGTQLCTYDKEFFKIRSVKLCKPGDFV
ncbi:hypothetical protein A3F07_02325 [candidate division WWE3 bacterium RIFCSPHIGHO2_12_FULL_38_15]|uniref:PIN domain-containing protein n=1 Tax=candidate division WWE3 bacterium RIFCSPHIGHO2_02_FULL_38_14 TaxID=1802620 RepID=A0A1F4VBD0_UNCKA|nr:MAG: hypothetical protein A3F07_02325 [candidate division WWE3 bacterium RIFCSPHIGHO2_12_FULL_38_15]OGC54240.1 MAG: hypothetical protein A3D91_01700 [candidate division WWE3 bacterium RIFCSPHIGHO2_02_FULL_38_14]